MSYDKKLSLTVDRVVTAVVNVVNVGITTAVGITTGVGITTVSTTTTDMSEHRAWAYNSCATFVHNFYRKTSMNPVALLQLTVALAKLLPKTRRHFCARARASCLLFY